MLFLILIQASLILCLQVNTIMNENPPSIVIDVALLYPGFQICVQLSVPYRNVNYPE